MEDHRIQRPMSDDQLINDIRQLEEKYRARQTEKPVPRNKYVLVLLAIPYLLLYILYFLISSKERMEYMVSVSKGYKCTGSKDTSLFLPGSERTFYFDPTQKPVRTHVTWYEFWKGKGY